MSDVEAGFTLGQQSYIEQAMQNLRNEFTVMPRFAYHQPLDYAYASAPPHFDPAVYVQGEDLPLPPPVDRMGYSHDNDEYLKWGKYDHDLILSRVRSSGGDVKPGSSIMDFGCSSGRVLRHFHKEHLDHGLGLIGVDVQARPIEWMRQNFPPHFCVYTGNVLPHLPFEDCSIDYIYGFSVFTHIKYLWDAWLLELRRVLKPGGLLLQTIHTENAWKFYYHHREEKWVQDALPPEVYSAPEMEVPFFYHGDVGVSQVFWRSDVARSYWARYFDVLHIYPPAELNSFQDMVVCRKSR